MNKAWVPEDPQKAYDALIERCKEARHWYVRCIVDESWTGFQGPAPFDVIIEDGIFNCRVVATTFREALLKVVDNVPVLKFLDEYNDE